MKASLTLVIFLTLALAGCASNQQRATDRTAKLRESFPPGMAKEEVQTKWGQFKPDFSASRPSGGWDAYKNNYIAKKISGMEASTGKRIESVDRYWGPDGFMSLCYCWYYYDSSGKIVDVEWQYKSD